MAYTNIYDNTCGIKDKRFAVLYLTAFFFQPKNLASLVAGLAGVIVRAMAKFWLAEPRQRVLLFSWANVLLTFPFHQWSFALSFCYMFFYAYKWSKSIYRKLTSSFARYSPPCVFFFSCGCRQLIFPPTIYFFARFIRNLLKSRS